MLTGTSSLLTEKEAAELLRISAGTLQVWRCTKRVPLLKYIKLKNSRTVRYRREDIDEFIAASIVNGDGSPACRPRRKNLQENKKVG
jgi:predicted DNA-binding transcriptional regulator AlpA